MCRNKDERNERCDCDTSEARRLRRHTRDALDRHAESAYQPITPNFLPSLLTEEPFTVESVREEISHLIPSIENLRSEGQNGNTIFALIDKKVNNVGAGVEYLSETKYGAPTDQELRDAYDSFGKPFLEQREIALASGMSEDEADEEAAERIDAEFQQTFTELIGKRNVAIRKALMDVGVQFANPDSIHCSANSDPEAVKALKKALPFYPQSWVLSSNSLHKNPLHVEAVKEGERAGYTHNVAKFGIFNRKSIITVSEDDDFGDGISVGIHEFGHRVEYSVPWITTMENFFVLRRSGNVSEDGTPTKGEDVTAIQDISPEASDGDEWGYKDNFPTHYMGKSYENGTWEVLAMGMETLFAGTNGGFAGIQKYKEDSDYKKFIIGILAFSASK